MRSGRRRRPAGASSVLLHPGNGEQTCVDLAHNGRAGGGGGADQQLATPVATTQTRHQRTWRQHSTVGASVQGPLTVPAAHYLGWRCRRCTATSDLAWESVVDKTPAASVAVLDPWPLKTVLTCLVESYSID